MSGYFGYAIIFLAGGALGAAYFAGLWLTVSRLPRLDRPHLALLGSFLLRAALAVVVLWLLAAGEWRRMAAALAGFVIARLLVVRRVRAGAGEV